jgi:hypothetical protein
MFLLVGIPGLANLAAIRFVFTNGITADAGAICDFMDWLAGSIVLSCHLHDHGSLHHIVLPRTWLINLSRIFKKPGNINITAIRSFIALAKDLLLYLCSARPSDFVLNLTFQVESFPLASLRDMYLSRVYVLNSNYKC